MLKECESEVLNKEGYILTLITEINHDDETVYIIKIEDKNFDIFRSTTINDNEKLAIKLYDAIKNSCKYSMPSDIGFDALINSISMRRKTVNDNRDRNFEPKMIENKNRWNEKDNTYTYIILYKTPEEGAWTDNIFTTDNENDFNDFLKYLKTKRVGNENFYLRVTNIRTIICQNNIKCDQILSKLIKEIK